MQTLDLAKLKLNLQSCSFAGRKHDFFDNIEENVCFGITLKNNRCKRWLTVSRRQKLVHSLNELVRLANIYDKNEENEDPAALLEAFFVNLSSFIDLQHCYLHKDQPLILVAEWKKRINDTVHDRESPQESHQEPSQEPSSENFQKQPKPTQQLQGQSSEHDEDSENDACSTASTVSSSSSSVFLCETPRHARVVTPSTTPQTDKIIQITVPTNRTHSTWSGSGLETALLDDDDDLPPPPTPTPCGKLECSEFGALLLPSTATSSGETDLGGRLSCGQMSPQEPQEQQEQKTPTPATRSVHDKRQELLVSPSGVSAAQNLLSDAITADKLAELEDNVEDTSVTPQLLKDPMTPHATDLHDSCRVNGFQNYRNCYIGTDYVHIVKTMQLKYTSSTRREGRLYVLQHPHERDVFKIGFSTQEDLYKRWKSTPCTKAAVEGDRTPVFTSKLFAGAWKAEALVKASLRHRRKIDCDMCHKKHNEWFRIERDEILRWVRAWMAFVQSDFYDESGRTTLAYDQFANRLLRITPERIHAQLANAPSQEEGRNLEETVETLTTANVHGARGGSSSGGSQTEEALPQPRTDPAVVAATPIQRFIIRAKTWESRSSFSSSKWRENKEERVDPGSMSGHGHSHPNMQKAAHVVSQVKFQIQSGISRMAKRGTRSSKRP